MSEIVLNPEAVELTKQAYAYVHPYIEQIFGFAILFGAAIPVLKLNKKTLNNN